MKRPTAARLREVLDYDRATGVFLWRHRTDVRGGWNAKCAGKVAGRLDSDGYRQIAVDGRRYAASKLAWVYVTGEWPAREVDHRNLDRADDRFENLRPATHAQNGANRGLPPTNTSGRKGVHWNKKLKKWQAAIKVGKRRVHLGVFTDIEAAAAAYAAAARQHHGDFARIA
jgi:hypothetical protein